MIRALILLLCVVAPAGAFADQKTASQQKAGGQTVASRGSKGPLDVGPTTRGRSIADRSFKLPTWQQWRRVLSLRDYNTRVVLLGTTLLGCAAGMVGSFTLLRKRALMGDALSHATLPGIALAFMVVTYYGGDGKSLPILLCGATISGLFGVIAILAIRNLTRLKEDTALGIVLSVFFGAGISLLAVIQQQGGSSAGLDGFIYGKTASMGIEDATLIGAAAAVCVGACLLIFKELKLLCFDEGFAGSRGVPILLLDAILMALVVVVSIVGLQAVGLVLMIALLVVPAAAARFWTEKMRDMMLISAMLGAISGLVGAAMSALFSNLPSGAMIVLVCAGFFLFSMFFGSARGVLIRTVRRARLNKSVDRQHLLRAIYESLEVGRDAGQRTLSAKALLGQRSWAPRRLFKAIRKAVKAGLVRQTGAEISLTDDGRLEATRLTRQHRLWELYLINYADTAPSRVDRDADDIEHVLEPEVVAKLEALLKSDGLEVPESPHDLDDAASTWQRYGGVS
jgi:manganese/zinc/iron transport system permease protein